MASKNRRAVKYDIRDSHFPWHWLENVDPRISRRVRIVVGISRIYNAIRRSIQYPIDRTQ